MKAVYKSLAFAFAILLTACRSAVPELTDVGLLDLRTHRLAMIHPDKIEYAASVAKVGILFACFVKHPEAARDIDPQTQRELGEMIKASSNEMAAKYSREIGLREIQQILSTRCSTSANSSPPPPRQK